MCTVDSIHACSDALLKLQPGDSIVYHVGLLARFGEPDRRPDEAAVDRAHTAAARVRELTRR